MFVPRITTCLACWFVNCFLWKPIINPNKTDWDQIHVNMFSSKFNLLKYADNTLTMQSNMQWRCTLHYIVPVTGILTGGWISPLFVKLYHLWFHHNMVPMRYGSRYFYSRIRTRNLRLWDHFCLMLLFVSKLFLKINKMYLFRQFWSDLNNIWL